MRILDKFLYTDEPQRRQDPPGKKELAIIAREYPKGGTSSVQCALVDAGYPFRSSSWITYHCSKKKIKGPKSGKCWRLPDRKAPTARAMTFILLLGLFLETRPVHASDGLRPILDAIRQVETGSRRDPASALGDDGRSFGPYQIQRRYWRDAWSGARVATNYFRVRDAGYAERTILRYWRRYCPRAMADRDARTLARVHNGGPRGPTNDRTLAYWSKVRRELARR